MMFLAILLATLAVLYKVFIGDVGIPVIDISHLLDKSASEDSKASVVAAIGRACRDVGFFYITETGVPITLTDRIENASRKFFSKPVAEKRAIEMKLGGKSWRGYFAVGDELTSGRPDQKEGIYFGTEGHANDTRPLHGPNLWPVGPDGEVLKADVLEYMAHMKRLGTVLMDAITKHLYSLKSSVTSQDESVLRTSFHDPTELFRIFGYPAPEPTSAPSNQEIKENSTQFGVGEHTDYGYLTILYQDDTGGLEVKGAGYGASDFIGKVRNYLRPWIQAPPIRGSFVINLGDALEHHSGGYLRATPHRVLFSRDAAHVGKQRISFPYFFDPNLKSEMTTVTLASGTQGLEEAQQRMLQRWDGEDVLLFRGTYEDYLKKKISRVFPELFATTQVMKEPLDTAVPQASKVEENGDFVVDFEDVHKERGSAIEQKPLDEVFEWTARRHSAHVLSAEEQVLEDELRERMRLWNERNA